MREVGYARNFLSVYFNNGVVEAQTCFVGGVVCFVFESNNAYALGEKLDSEGNTANINFCVLKLCNSDTFYGNCTKKLVLSARDIDC